MTAFKIVGRKITIERKIMEKSKLILLKIKQRQIRAITLKGELEKSAILLMIKMMIEWLIIIS